MGDFPYFSPTISRAHFRIPPLDFPSCYRPKIQTVRSDYEFQKSRATKQVSPLGNIQRKSYLQQRALAALLNHDGHHQNGNRNDLSDMRPQLPALRKAPQWSSASGAPNCKKTYTEPHTRTLDTMYISQDEAVLALQLLLEGNSIRSTERPDRHELYLQLC